MYGKSYDGVTGLIGVDQQPAGLDAVVSQEPVYDLYRYLYGDGMRRANSVAHARAVRPDRRDAGPARRRPELQRRTALNDTQRPGCPVAQLRRPGRQRRPLLGVLAAAQPDPGREGLERAAVPDPGADREQHGRRRHRAVPAEPHRLRARLARPVGARARQRDRRERPPEDGPRGLVRRGHALLRPVPQGRRRRRSPTRRSRSRPTTASGAPSRAGRPPTRRLHDAAALRHLHRRRHGQRDRRRRRDGRLDDLAAAAARRPPVGLRAAPSSTSRPRCPNANLVRRRLRPRRERHRPADHAPGPPDRAKRRRSTLDLWSADWKIPAGHRIGVKVTDANGDWWVHVPTKQTRHRDGGSVSLPFLPAARAPARSRATRAPSSRATCRRP